MEQIYHPHERRPKVTMKDVAQKVGVNIAAVSVVLNGSKSGTKVSQIKREAILAAAAELGYRPNVLARSLRRQRTGMIGFYSGYDRLTTHNLYLNEILAGVYDGCRNRKLDLLLHVWETDAEAPELLRSMGDGRIDGVIVHQPPDNPLSMGLLNIGIPVIAVTDKLPDVPCVVIDDEAGGRMQAECLLAKGHKKVLYRGSAIPFTSTEERYRSFRATMESAGGQVFDGAPLHSNDFPWESPGLRPWEFGGLALRPLDKEILAKKEVTAIAVWDATIAHYTAWELRQMGVKIPDEIAIMGYDGGLTMLPPLFDLTTIRCDHRAVGQAAVEYLSSLIDGESCPPLTQIPPGLILGETV